MRVAIVGAGAIGGWIGIILARAGHEVSVLARGATLARLQNGPWRMERAGETVGATVVASDDAAVLGEQDVIVVAVKGPALSLVAPALAPMIGKDTIVLPAMNGVPWWFLLGGGGELPPMPLTSVDPGGKIAAAIPTERIVGCVVHASVSVAANGTVRHGAGNGLVIGEPRGGQSERVAQLSEMLTEAGFDVTASPAIRQAVWYKLWGNMTINPISALTGATADAVLDDPLVADFVLTVMAEAKAVGARIGCPIAETGEDRNRATRRLGAFRTSMLQDAEAGRALELDTLLAAPREIARQLAMPTPAIDTVFGLARLMGRSRNLYPNA